MSIDLDCFYVCERCFSAAETSGACPRCHLPRRQFRVGPPGDPERRPPVDAAGQMLCRAPLWWIQSHAPYLRRDTGGEA
jgi:hypothetical protein